ncbi:MAG: uroporphyrinogen decarboxylase family protein [bacterium]
MRRNGYIRLKTQHEYDMIVKENPAESPCRMIQNPNAVTRNITMTPKERMMRALNREKPDRLPVSLHQWQKFHLDEYLGGISDIEAFEKFGFDAQAQYFGNTGQVQEGGASLSALASDWILEEKVIDRDPNHRISHYTIHTPGGDLSYKTCGNRQTIWVTEFLVKRDDDIGLIDRYMPVSQLNLQVVSELYDRLGDRGILRGFVWGDQAGCWQHACCLMDVHQLIVACFDKPGWVHEFLSILLQKKLQFIETMKGAQYDLIETGGGAGSSTVISPKIHEQFCLPYDRKIHDALHGLGFKISYHTCGGTSKIEDLIAANGCDVTETLAPISIGGNQEPWEFAAKIRNRLAMIGGLDQFNVLTLGTPETIRAMVFELFEKVGKEGGYICSASDHFFETPLENLQAFSSAAKECVY